MYWRSSHIPFTFFRKQMDLPAPPRFVKFISRASSPTQGLFRTVPTSDHVPELMNAQSSPLAGIAAIADAVADLGKPEAIGQVFVGFQKYLYQEAA